MEFGGNALAAAGWLVLFLLGTVLILPGAWVFAGWSRWFCRNLEFSDGSRAEFTGRGGDVLGWWVLALVSGGIRFYPAINIGILVPNHWSVTVFLFPLSCLGWWQVLRWFVRNVRFSSGARYEFTGGYWELVGWYVLNAVAVVTVIGWAWSWAGMYRWLARNTRTEELSLRFHGEGQQVLWRIVAAVVMSLGVVTIPWAWLWYTRWLVANVTVEGQVGEAAVE